MGNYTDGVFCLRLQCVHRATAFDASMLPNQLGSRGSAPVRVSAPVPEAYGSHSKYMLSKQVDAHAAEVAVHSNVRGQPGLTHAALESTRPLAERLAENFFRTGGVPPDQIKKRMVETRRGHGKNLSSLAQNFKTEVLAVACVQNASPPDMIVKCEYASPESHSLVILTDRFRAKQLYKCGTWEGDISALTYRGIVMDYARQFCHRCVPSVTGFHENTFAHVSSSQDSTERPAGGSMDAVDGDTAPSGTRREGTCAHCHGGYALASQREHDGGGTRRD